MTFQQLKYAIKIAETGSISAAAKELYISQPSLSKAVIELEQELDTTLFIREKTGIRLTENGRQFIRRAKQVKLQMDMLEKEISSKESDKIRFSIATHHYTFVVNATAELIKEIGAEDYEFAVREMPTSLVIDDVKNGISEIGFLYISSYNREVISRKLLSEGLEYNFLFRERPHVCLSADHPLAKKAVIAYDDLKEYPRINYEQRQADPYYFYEEVCSENLSSKVVKVADKASMVYMLNKLNAYNITTSILDLGTVLDGVVTIPLYTEEYIDIGYIHIAGRPLSQTAQRFIELAVEHRNSETEQTS